MDRIDPSRHACLAAERAACLRYCALRGAIGRDAAHAKPLKGFGGAGVLELMEDARSGTYRAVYTVRFATAVYVLHVFQKKLKKHIETPQMDIELIRQRLK